MGMYLIKKGTPCVIGKQEEDYSKGRKWVTRREVCFWKEELVSNIGGVMKFVQWPENAEPGQKHLYWMSVKREFVDYG